MAERDLTEQFFCKSNFIRAYRRIASKKALGGIDGVSVEAFGRRLERNIQTLIQKIRDHTYVPQPVKSLYIPKFNEDDEWRELGLPAVADKVVQAALLHVVEPLAEKLFLDTSYGYRPGKGHYRAIKRVDHNLQYENRKWVVHRDIDNFFDTIDHNRLLSQFADLVGGEPLLIELVALWCRMGIVDRNGRWRNVEAGIRQGQVISPLLANLYLHPLDKFVEELNVGWVRYADDFLIQCRNSQEAKAIREFLQNPLSLRLNKDSNSISHIDRGFTFLGVHFHKDTRCIAEEKMKKIKKKIFWLLSDKNKADLKNIISRLNQMADGWKRYYAFLNPLEQFAQIQTLMEECFVNLARKRIKQGLWEKDLKKEITFPVLNDKASVSMGLKRMQSLWRQAVETSKEESLKEIKKKVDLKVSRRRQRHHREQIQKGEIVITTPGHFIGKKGERIIVREKQRIVAELPVIQLSGLTISSKGVAISGDVIELCMKKGVYIHFADEVGRITAIINLPGGFEGNISLLQVKERDTEKGLHLARMFVLGKVKNQLALLKYYYKYPVNRKNGFGEVFMERLHEMEHLIKKIKRLHYSNDPDLFRRQLMGLEGAFAIHYWNTVKHLFNNGIVFKGRERHGARDIVNASLNYGYGILYGKVLNAVIKAGLNPMAGFLHSCQPDKPVLIYDIVEEFRSMVVDRGVFTLLRRGEKLAQEEDGMLTSDSRKKIVRAVIKRLACEASFSGHRETIENIIHIQAGRLKKYLFGKLGYRPFLARW